MKQSLHEDEECIQKCQESMKEPRGLSASDLIDCVVAPQENCSIQKQSVCEKFNRMFSILEERQKVRVQPLSSVTSGL